MTSRRPNNTPFWYYETSELNREFRRLNFDNWLCPWPFRETRHKVDKRERRGVERSCSVQINVKTSDNCLSITLSLPGLSYEDVDVKAIDDRINITTKKPPHACSENVNYSYMIDTHIDRSKITASMCNGLLTIKVPCDVVSHDATSIPVLKGDTA